MSVRRAFRVVFLCAAFVALKEIQIRFSLPSLLPSSLPPAIHRSTQSQSPLRTAVRPLHSRYLLPAQKKEAREEDDGDGGEEIVSQGHLCNQVTTAAAAEMTMTTCYAGYMLYG